MDAISLLIALKTLMFIVNNPEISPTIEQRTQIEALVTYLNTPTSSENASGEEKVKKTKKDKKKKQTVNPEPKTEQIQESSPKEPIQKPCIKPKYVRAFCPASA